MPPMPTLLFFLLVFLLRRVHAFSSYDNDFVNPDYILSTNFPNTTWRSQVSIVAWANDVAASGPWSVVNKTITPPSGDLHDYMSWAPYSWPNCTGVGNTTELTEEQIWTTCPYYTRDGEFNPDGRLVNDVGAFQNLSDAVLYNAITWAFRKESSNIYSKRVVQYLQTWFINPATKMNPNLNFAQMQRGPDGQIGTHTGVLDLKGFAKIATGILFLRKGQSTDWTGQLDEAMNAWCTTYIRWLETSQIALEEGQAKNNHGTFYYNQLAALKLIVSDLPGALNVTQTYFNGQFKTQIAANGEQPLEAARTRPYHYHAYNLAAMITNARLQLYASPSGPNPFYFTALTGATIQTALNFALTLDPATSGEADHAAELAPNVAAAAAAYGDPKAVYTGFLTIGGSEYVQEAYFLWDQPLAGGTPGNFQANDPDPNQIGINMNASTNAAQSGSSSSGDQKPNDQKTNDAGSSRMTGIMMLPVAVGMAVLSSSSM